MRKKLLLFSIFFLFGFSTSVQVAAAALYFVNNCDSHVWSDSHTDGLASNPCYLSSYGLGQILGGDTIYINVGASNEEAYINGPSGMAVVPAIIRYCCCRDRGAMALRKELV